MRQPDGYSAGNMQRRSKLTRVVDKGPDIPVFLSMVVSTLLSVVLVVMEAANAYAFGRLPLVSEDPSSPCAATLYTSIAYSLGLIGPGRNAIGQQQFRSHLDMAVPLFHLNYGISDRIQGRVAGQFPLTAVAPDNGGLAVGFGDFSTGLKYRFMDQVNGREYSDSCAPQQSEALYGLHGPVSISVFPQFSFPIGSESRGLGSGEYSLAIPVDIARQIGKLYLVGEVEFLWLYHNHVAANELEEGVAVSYALSSKWNLLAEQRLDSATSGRGASLWLTDVGVVYQFSDRAMLFGAIGTSVAATSTVAPANFSTILGTRVIISNR